MGEPRVIPAGGGEVLGDSPDRRVELLSDHDSVHVTWSRFGPHRDGADLHVHYRHTDLFYVLRGELTVMLGPEGDEVAVPAGSLVRVPAGVVHGFRNASGSELRYLNIHAPGQGFAEFMRALRDGREPSYDQHPPPPDGGRPATEAVIRADGPVSDRAGARSTLLADVEEIAAAEVRGEPGTAPPPPPYVSRHTESFYVLEGEMALTIGDRELRARAGSWAQVPPGVAHCISFPGPEPARVLELRTPGRGSDGFQPAPRTGA